ncbi:HEAT repeat domain-containing protein [Planctomycetales bacterium ZRK34]|nr:HEAT repeat domain-containing protein [Planctomycetales bacterium ZRK34]
MKRFQLMRVCLGAVCLSMLAGTLNAADENETKLPTNLPELRETAVKILVEASFSDVPLLRANALEGMQAAPDRALPLATRLLNDPNPAVRYVAVVTAGMLKFDSLSTAIRPLLRDEHPSVQAAAIYALRAVGENIDLTPLAGLLERRDPGLRGNVAQLLGLLGDPSAVPMLNRAALLPMPRVSATDLAVVRIQIAEAMARLGDDDALDALRSGAFSQFDEVRVLAIVAMGEVKDRRMEVALERLADQPPVEIQVAAAGALARMGNTTKVQSVLDAARHVNPIVRGQAAVNFAYFSDDRSLVMLRNMLIDEEPIVRVSAAAAVLKRLSK